MIPEIEILLHVDHVVAAVLILLPDVIQDPHFNQRLVMKAFFISDDLDGHMLVGHVIQGAYHLPKAAFSNHFKDFIAIAYVVVQDLEFCMLISVLRSRYHR